MRAGGKILLIILFAMGINRACSLLPEHVYFDPFPLYDILDKDGNNVGISIQSFVYMISVHAATIAFCLFCMLKEDRYSDLFEKFMYIEILSLVDFFIIYEHSWIKIPVIEYGLEFTDIKLGFYTYYIILWNRFTI